MLINNPTIYLYHNIYLFQCDKMDKMLGELTLCETTLICKKIPIKDINFIYKSTITGKPVVFLKYFIFNM